MLPFPTWVLMRQMNIHEEEADIAVWWLCSGCLCAPRLWWPCFWGICCSACRHQGTLALMMQMCASLGWLFAWWLWMTLCQRWRLSFASSCWWRRAREHEIVTRSCCLHFSSYSTSSLWSWLVINRCHGPTLPGTIWVPLLSLPPSCYLSIASSSTATLSFLEHIVLWYSEMPELSLEGHSKQHVAISSLILRPIVTSVLLFSSYRRLSGSPPSSLSSLLSR